jgi:Flp pilus assembly protein CpaB
VSRPLARLARRLFAAGFAAATVAFALLALRPSAPPVAATPTRSAQPSGLLTGHPDQVAVPVRIADAAAARLLHPGDRIDVLAGPATETADLGTRLPARLVAAGVSVLAVPKESPGEDGALIVLATDRTQATELAEAGPRLSVTILPR